MSYRQLPVMGRVTTTAREYRLKRPIVVLFHDTR